MNLSDIARDVSTDDYVLGAIAILLVAIVMYFYVLRRLEKKARDNEMASGDAKYSELKTEQRRMFDTLQ
jgi:hypothetical protein